MGLQVLSTKNCIKNGLEDGFRFSVFGFRKNLPPMNATGNAFIGPLHLVPKLLLRNQMFRQSSCFAGNPESPLDKLAFAKLELGGQGRSQAGAWERVQSSFPGEGAGATF
jgi:hypothetical protein